MQRKKHRSNVRLLTRSLMTLFCTKRGLNPSKVYPIDYHRHYYLSEPLCNGIELVAKIERTSKKQAAELLMKAGLSSYMGAKLTKYIQDDRAASELNQKVKMTRFVQVLRRYAREHGMDISKII